MSRENKYKEELEYMFTKRCCFNCKLHYNYELYDHTLQCHRYEGKRISAATPACEQWAIVTNIPKEFHWAKSITNPEWKEPVQLNLFEQ